MFPVLRWCLELFVCFLQTRNKKKQDVGYEEVGRTCTRTIGVQLAWTLQALLWSYRGGKKDQ